MLGPIRHYCVFVKVKSHLDDPSKWQEYNMTIPAYHCNNGADKAADAKAKLLQTEKGADVILADNKQWKETYQVALRIGSIEAYVYEHFDSKREKIVATPSNTKSLICTKRKFDAAMLSTLPTYTWPQIIHKHIWMDIV